ncbi:hypothetical protein FACS189499_01650 [Clostridia bacterium]|nr:hypothetical protein FACS189499_01650 [Clostridia bacterium]
MMKSLYSGVSGLKTHNQRMDVIGNNIANVNTTGYKAGTVTFKDVFYQTKAGSTQATAVKGATNSRQVGYGVKLGTIDEVMTQSGLTFSDNVYDCALQGEGFFQVMDQAGNIYYTRNGVFRPDPLGNFTDANGYIVLGVSGDPNGVAASTQRIQFNVPPVQNNIASASKMVNGYEVTISADGYGKEGNISVTLTHSEVPFATLNGQNLVVQLNLTEEFQNQGEFEQAINEAIRAGGVDLPDAAAKLHVSFDSLPTTVAHSDGCANIGTSSATAAQSAHNRMEFVSQTDIMDPANPSGAPLYPKGSTYNLEFVARTKGTAANKFEIDVKVSDISKPSAKWNDNVLTITLPKTSNATLNEIQDAINLAAGMTPKGNPISSWEDNTGNPAQWIDVLQVQNVGGDWKIVDVPTYDEQEFAKSVKFTNLASLVAGDTFEFTMTLPDVSGGIPAAALPTGGGSFLVSFKAGADVNATVAAINTAILNAVAAANAATPPAGITVTPPTVQLDGSFDLVATNWESEELKNFKAVPNVGIRIATDETGYFKSVDWSVDPATGAPIASPPFGTYISGTAFTSTWNFGDSVGTSIKRLGLNLGQDNFYREAANSMATMGLKNGRVEALQTHADLDSIFIDSSGVIYGDHPVHGRLYLGRIDVATFLNPTGLEQVGTSYWKEGLASGAPTVKNAGADGAGEVVSGATEMSNVDLSQEFSDMIITQRGFQANSRIITVSDTMLEELINLKR